MSALAAWCLIDDDFDVVRIDRFAAAAADKAGAKSVITGDVRHFDARPMWRGHPSGAPLV